MFHVCISTPFPWCDMFHVCVSQHKSYDVMLHVCISKVPHSTYPRHPPDPPVYQTFGSVGRNAAHPVMGSALLPRPRIAKRGALSWAEHGWKMNSPVPWAKMAGGQSRVTNLHFHCTTGATLNISPPPSCISDLLFCWPECPTSCYGFSFATWTRTQDCKTRCLRHSVQRQAYPPARGAREEWEELADDEPDEDDEAVQWRVFGKHLGHSAWEEKTAPSGSNHSCSANSLPNRHPHGVRHVRGCCKRLKLYAIFLLMNSEFDTGRPTKSAAASQSCSMSGSGRASVGFMDWAGCSKARSSCFATWMDLCQAIKLAHRSVLHVVKEDARPNSWIRSETAPYDEPLILWRCGLWRPWHRSDGWC